MSPSSPSVLRATLACLLALSCGGGADSSPEPTPTDGADGATADGTDGEDGGDGADGQADGGDGADGTEVPIDPTAVCGELGLPSLPFVDAADDDSLYALAADLTLPTRRGDWTLSEHWSGCDSYLFIPEEPRQSRGYDWSIWERDHRALFERLPPNVHLFFIGSSGTADGREEALDALSESIDAELRRLDDAEAAWWTDRIHYVTERDRSLPGWLGDTLTSPGWGTAIDRHQRLRYIGSFADYTRYDESAGWFGPNLSMVANEPVYFNFEATREAGLEADDARVIPVFAGEQGSAYVDVTLPDAADLASADTLDIDLTMACIGEGEFGTCPAWDYMAYVYLCDLPAESVNPHVDTACVAGDTLEGACDSPLGEPRAGAFTCRADGSGYDELVCERCDVEVARWITTYHREGRWVYDISPMLPLFQSGGPRRLRFESSNRYELTGSLRFKDTGKAQRPASLTYLPLDGGEGAFSIPDTAVKVELATVISQHGQPCGEFCDAAHTFVFNGDAGAAIVRSFPDAETPEGCMDQVADGTVPNQYGTWWYGRAGWCPGKEVKTVTHDITDQVMVGENTVTYTAGPNAGTVRRRAWVLVSE